MHRMQEAFNARLPALEVEAIRTLQEGPTVGMAHVAFPFHGLQVTAVFNAMEQRFTQLVARDESDTATVRPSYTLNLFL